MIERDLSVFNNNTHERSVQDREIEHPLRADIEVEDLKALEHTRFADLNSDGVKRTVLQNGDRTGVVDSSPSIAINRISYNFDPRDDQEAVDNYARQLRQYPVLASDQLRRAFEVMLQGGTLDELKKDPVFNRPISENPEKYRALLADSKSIRDLIANANLRLALSYSKWYIGRLPLADIIQEGNAGLLRAIDKFDPEKKVTTPAGIEKKVEFSTYATWWVRKNIQQAINSQAGLIRFPAYATKKRTVANRLALDFQTKNNRLPTEQELKELLINSGNLSESEANGTLRIMKSNSYSPSSLDLQIGEEGETSLGDIIASNEDTENFVISEITNTENSVLVEKILCSLPERTANIIRMRYMEGKTLQEIGEAFDISRERVRQISEKAMTELRARSDLRRELDG